jgi:hypothetical protein
VGSFQILFFRVAFYHCSWDFLYNTLFGDARYFCLGRDIFHLPVTFHHLSYSKELHIYGCRCNNNTHIFIFSNYLSGKKYVFLDVIKLHPIFVIVI